MFPVPALESYHLVLALDDAGDLQGWVQVCVQDAARGMDAEGRLALDASSHLQIRRVTVSLQPSVSAELLHPDVLGQGSQFAEVGYSHDADSKKLVVTVPAEFRTSRFYLGIRYTCLVQQSDIGVFTFSPFIRTPGQSISNPTIRDVFGIATQFEPCHTANAFPCWDHPSCKAKFQFRFLVPNSLQVLSCGELAGTHAHDQDSQWWLFDETIPLPPYVTGFWIAEFHAVEVARADGRVVRAQCFKQAQTTEADFSLKLGLASWQYFEELFGVPIPTQKMDLIALPRLHGLAMENFSAITFRDEYLFVGPDTSHQRERRIARLICHEMSHMYWGNLVTLTTFDELWLKEGMARFFEYVAVEDIDPSYQIWINFLTDVYMQAMEMDSKPQATHPVVQFHNGDMTKIMDSFDLITYGKGACILRMLYHLLGQDRFAAGMKECVTRHHLGNMSTDDLWACLQESVDRSELNLREVMMPWLLQPGFPLIFADCAVDEHSAPTALILQQLNFQRTESQPAPQQLWPIPLIVRLFYEARDGSILERSQRVVFSTATHEIALPSLDGEALRLVGLIVNGYHAAFCCTLYGAALWNYYSAAVTSTTATDEERFGVAIDHLFLSKATGLPISSATLLQRGAMMNNVFKNSDEGSLLAKGFGRIYLLVPAMHRVSRTPNVTDPASADILTREVEELERECEEFTSQYAKLGKKYEEVCVSMMTLHQHVLVAKSTIAESIARFAELDDIASPTVV